MVGAIIVLDRTGEIVAEGYHRGYGLPHAEVEVIECAKRKGVQSFSGMTLYVNLEPCCHHGKTPPCSDRIVTEGFRRVVFGTLDPFAEVSGKGLEFLERHGVKVEHGILEEACKNLNKAFFKQIRTGIPFVTIKLAQTLDGQIATFNGDSKWISGESSRRVAHKLRSTHDAVLVGANTVIADDPELTVRMVRGNNPWRIVLDSRLRSPLTATVFSDDRVHETILVTSPSASKKKMESLKKRGVLVLPTSPRIKLKQVLMQLRNRHNIGSILVEGGSTVASAFFEKGLVDEFVFFIAPKLLGNGRSAFSGLTAERISQTHGLEFRAIKRVGDDLMVTAVPK